MAEKRTAQTMVYLEDTIADLLDKAARKESVSTSSYIRKLIINDLVKHKMITSDVLLQLITGAQNV